MVFFTAILIVAILYFMQAEGIIFVTIIAMAAELVNIYMAHTLTKSVEKKMQAKHNRLAGRREKKLKAAIENIKALEEKQDEAAIKLYKANLKIKNYEEQLGIQKGEDTTKEPGQETSQDMPIEPGDSPEQALEPEPLPKEFDDLPDGSNRKLPPV